MRILCLFSVPLIRKDIPLGKDKDFLEEYPPKIPLTPTITVFRPFNWRRDVTTTRKRKPGGKVKRISKPQ